MNPETAAIQFNDLRRSYGVAPALAGLSLDVFKGEIVGLIGPDGAGKSTAMRIACALIKPDSGMAVIAGFDPVTQPQRVKEHIGYMPQRFSLYPDLSVIENLRFFADLYAIPDGKRIQQEQRLLEFSRLEPFKNRRAGQLSGGMKQKLALSCTLIHAPDILFLDEPTTGVDPVSRQEFWTILRELAQSDKALLVSTPYMDEAELCDRIVLMHQGATLAAGSPDRIPELFPRKLIEIISADIEEVIDRLKQITNIEIHRIGGKLRIVHNDPKLLERLRELLKDLELTLQDVPPSIEETLIYLMQHEQAA
ncbi:ABC transporter ATP-binding protein [bacterium]|nr:ABC transporter ATP-binding protein [bacterium]MBU1636461.1 ABC transporter ATP-binding protein [bacterium]MBU1921527.1 ABC transporter ATP-binding protein [bacterium]